MLLNPREAKADHNGPGISVDFVRVHRSSGFGVSSIVERAGYGVCGQVNNSATDHEWAGVAGVGDIGVQGAGRNIGVKGTGHGVGVFGSDSTWGVYGLGKTAGVLARGPIGVYADGQKYGGLFKADKKGGAQLYLQPGESRDRPTIGDHARGELYMDATGTLFVCTDGGNPGLWRVFQTSPA
jgi:hypothetical protein